MSWLDVAHETATTIGIPVALFFAGQAIALARKHGYKMTYANALLRAVGTGQLAATDAGETMFTPAGRAIAVRAGEQYLIKTVAPEALALGIGDDDHAIRVDGQIGALAAAAAAAAVATPEAVAGAATALLADAANRVQPLIPINPAPSGGPVP